MQTFRLLFSVLVEHLYFSNRLCRPLEFIPTDDCRKTIERTGLIFKKDISGIRIFHDVTRTDVLLLFADDPREPLHFSFKVYSQDPRFSIYTDLPAVQEKSILYFDNRRVGNPSSGDIILNQDEYVSEKDIEPLSSEAVKKILTPRDRGIRPVFILNICAGNHHRHLFDKQLKVTPKQYLIKFKSRKTYWKYYLLNELDRDDVYIEDLHAGIEFEKLHHADLPGRRPASVFRSRTAVPLLENSPYHFQLKEKNAGKGKVLIKRLPVASPDHMHKEIRRDTATAISEIFINI